MLEYKIITRTPALQRDPIARVSAETAQEIAAGYANYLKTSIVRRKAIATGKLLRSPRVEFVLDSPSRGLFQRNVTANRSWINVQNGRRAGAKMPVHRVGRRFEPLPELVEWFTALNIPRSAWFPILRAIKRRGIKPRDLQKMTMAAFRPRMSAILARKARELKEILEASAGKK